MHRVFFKCLHSFFSVAVPHRLSSMPFPRVFPIAMTNQFQQMVVCFGECADSYPAMFKGPLDQMYYCLTD